MTIRKEEPANTAVSGWGGRRRLPRRWPRTTASDRSGEASAQPWERQPGRGEAGAGPCVLRRDTAPGTHRTERQRRGTWRGRELGGGGVRSGQWLSAGRRLSSSAGHAAPAGAR